MLQWPHSGFHVHTGVGVSEDDRPFALRLARYYARNPLALDRLTYDPAAEQITDPRQVMTCHYGWYASRTRGTKSPPRASGR